MAKVDGVVLDWKDKILFDRKNPPIANLHAIDFLPRGLRSLSDTVREQEDLVNEHNREHYERPPTIEIGGTAITDNSLVMCCFHWFSVSLLNYLRLVGFVQYCSDNPMSAQKLRMSKTKEKINTHCNEYSRRVSPDIYQWRNKVGAHMALTAPLNRDNIGTLEVSAMNSIAFSDERFYVGKAKWVSGGESSSLPAWSVTEEFEKLSVRFWPTDGLPMNFQSKD